MLREAHEKKDFVVRRENRLTRVANDASEALRMIDALGPMGGGALYAA